MKIFVFSDAHLWHDKIVTLCNRPLDYVDRITRGWDARVGPEDVVIDLGDLSFKVKRAIEWLNQRPGIKIKVIGNHDPESKLWYFRNGYNFACDTFTMYDIMFSHRPLDPCDIPMNHINVHGHTHQLYKGFWDDVHWAFSPELMGYAPINLDTILNERLRRDEELRKQVAQDTPVNAQEAVGSTKRV